MTFRAGPCPPYRGWSWLSRSHPADDPDECVTQEDPRGGLRHEHGCAKARSTLILADRWSVSTLIGGKSILDASKACERLGEGPSSSDRHAAALTQDGDARGCISEEHDALTRPVWDPDTADRVEVEIVGNGDGVQQLR